MRLRRPLTAVAGLAAAAALALTGCASGSPSGETEASTEPSAAASGATDEFPITIEHAFGETVIESEPQRVATWGWGSTEAAIAAGVFPVAVAEQTWTVGEQTLLPWVEEAYDEAGVEHPTILTDAEQGGTVPYEEFVEATPDVILAPYSGITQEQYDTLSEIAPVVAYPTAPWQTPWDEIITTTAGALGRSEAGEQVVTDIEGYLAEEAEAHPEFAGKTVATVVDDPTNAQVYIYRSVDPRAGFLEGLGLETAPAVDELAPADSEFFYTLSYEELDELESDVVVAYTYSPEEAKAFDENTKLQAIPAVKAGMVAKVVGRVETSAVSPPTALSVTWEKGMPALVDTLAGVLAE